MNELHAIAYLSITSHNLFQDEIDHLLTSSREFNEQNEITGVLLCNSSLFYQYFEGSPEKVEILFERIKKDNRHKIMIEVFNQSIDYRVCTKWTMGFCRPPNSIVQKRAHQEWIQKASILKHKRHESLGMEMLMRFWSNLGIQ